MKYKIETDEVGAKSVKVKEFVLVLTPDRVTVKDGADVLEVVRYGHTKSKLNILNTLITKYHDMYVPEDYPF